MAYRAVLPFFSVLALAMGKPITPHRRIRSTSAMQQHHRKQQRHLQEFCGQCTWSGTIVCEARAQYLVKNDPTLTISQARNSILNECTSDGSEEVQLTLDAFCNTCQWQNANFNCKARAEFLVSQYKLTMDKAKESLLEKRECVDPNYKPPKAETEDSQDGGGMSIGAIVGLIVAVTALLMGGIIFWAWRRERNSKRDKPSEVSVPMGTSAADNGGGGAFKDYNQQLMENTLQNSIPLGDVVQIVNNPNSAMKKTSSKKKKKKSISFAIDRPDAPGESHCDASEYKYEDGLNSGKDVDGNEISKNENKPNALKISWNDDSQAAEPEGGSPVNKDMQDPEETRKMGSETISVKENAATATITARKQGLDSVVSSSSSDQLKADDAMAGCANEQEDKTTELVDASKKDGQDLKGNDAKKKVAPVDP